MSAVLSRFNPSCIMTKRYSAISNIIYPCNRITYSNSSQSIHLLCRSFCASTISSTSSSSSDSDSTKDTAATSAQPIMKRIKHKTPVRRASALLNILQKEEYERLKNGRQWPEINSGDSVMIERLPYITATEPEILKGVVIAHVKRNSDTSLTLLQSEYGTPYQRCIPLYNPLITNITVLQRAFIHKGLKRVRRSKLYYLKDRDPKFFTVK